MCLLFLHWLCWRDGVQIPPSTTSVFCCQSENCVWSQTTNLTHTHRRISFLPCSLACLFCVTVFPWDWVWIVCAAACVYLCVVCVCSEVDFSRWCLWWWSLYTCRRFHNFCWSGWLSFCNAWTDLHTQTTGTKHGWSSLFITWIQIQIFCFQLLFLSDLFQLQYLFLSPPCFQSLWWQIVRSAGG